MNILLMMKKLKSQKLLKNKNKLKINHSFFNLLNYITFILGNLDKELAKEEKNYLKIYLLVNKN